MIHSTSCVTFHHVKRSVDADEEEMFTVVRWDTDDSVRVEKDVIDIIKLLSTGKTISEVAAIKRYPLTEVITVVNTLLSLGLVQSIDEHRVADVSKKIYPWFPHIERFWFRWTVSKPFLLMTFIFTISGLLIGVMTPEYLPSYKDYFWTDDLLIVFFFLFVIGTILLIVHEVGHFVATKAVGGEAKMRLNYRYIYLVAETESYHLAVVPKSLRYLVYFAGMFVDFFIIALIYWIFKTSDMLHIQLGIIRNMLSAVILLQISGIIWQYNVYLETDMYNFLTDFLRLDYLKEDAEKWMAIRVKKWKGNLLQPLKHIFLRFFYEKRVQKEAEDLRFFRKKDRWRLIAYGILLLSGLLFTTFEYIFLIIPRELVYITASIRDFTTGFQTSSILSMAKSALLFLLITYQYVLLIFLVGRKNWKR